MPRDQMFFQLPVAFRQEDVLPLLSANAQIYVACSQCGWEDRANPARWTSSKSALATPCRNCGSKKRAVIRHWEQVEGECLDCGHDLSDTVTAPWLDLKCGQCGSHRLNLKGITISPPYPKRFGKAGLSLFGTDKEELWGVNPLKDGEQINEEVAWAVQLFPDSHLHILCEVLFCSTLCSSDGYENLEEFCWLVSLQGQLLKDYFRTTGDFAAAARALTLQEQAAELAFDAFTRAAIEHNCAMLIYSILTQYPEDVAGKALERPRIREEGIALARRVLAEYEKQLASEPPRNPAEPDDKRILTARFQVGRTHHLVGDLLRIGNADQAQIREALEQFEKALGFELPDYLLIGVMQSRGETIAMLDDPTQEQLLQAEQDLIASISADEKRIARSFQWGRFVQLATIARKLGAKNHELVALQGGASFALLQIRQNSEEWILQQRSERMLVLFDNLARAYVEADQPLEALAAAETLRAATVRLHTMDDTDQERLEKEAVSILAKDLGQEFFDESDPQQTPEPIAPVVLGLLEYLRRDKISTACISYMYKPYERNEKPEMIAFICGPSDSKEPDIEVATWPAGDDSIAWSVDLISPGPFRERNLKRIHTVGYEAFFKAIEPTLQRWDVKRIVFCLPGGLTRIAFEALIDEPKADSFLLDRYEVAYVPSLRLGYDLTKINKAKRGGRLLVVGYQGDDLTNAAREVDVLHTLFGERMVLLSGADCNKLSVLDQLRQDYEYIHFVCHGTYDAESPLDAALHFVPDVQSDSQRVTAGDIMSTVKFHNNPVVTMSACSTALMSLSPQNNCHGLTGSLLRAGARCVIGSRWPVYDEVAAAFMSRFYEKVVAGKGSKPLRYVAEVQREMRADQGIEDFAAFGYMGIP